MGKCFGVLLLTGVVFAQAGDVEKHAEKALAFEVASVKPSQERPPTMGRSGAIMKVDDARVDISNATVAELIGIAFRVRPYQVTGPAWLKATGGGVQRFTIQAKLPDGTSKDQAPEMLQTLLAERFQLAFHREDKEQSVFALVVGKNGTKLRETGTPEPASEQKVSQVPGGNTIHVEREMTMPELCDMAMRFLDRPVVEMTEMTGRYHMLVELSIDDMRTIASRNGNSVDNPRPAGMAADPTGGTIFSSVQDMGLKLDPRKMTIPLLVIDKVEKSPVEN